MISSVKPDVDILDIPVDSYPESPPTGIPCCRYSRRSAPVRIGDGTSGTPGLADRRDTVADAVRSNGTRGERRVNGPSNGWTPSGPEALTVLSQRSGSSGDRVDGVSSKTIGFSGRGTP